MIKISKIINRKCNHCRKWNLLSLPPDTKNYWPQPKGMLFTVSSIMFIIRHPLKVTLGSLNTVIPYSKICMEPQKTPDSLSHLEKE